MAGPQDPDLRRPCACGVARTRGKAIPIINALASYLPHFLALTASSPFRSGQDTGLASSRAIIFGALPHCGPAAPALRTGASSRSTWTRCCGPAPSAASRRSGGTSGRIPTSARSRSACSTARPPLREVGMVAALCAVPGAAVRLPARPGLPARRVRRPGSFATTSGVPRDMVLTRRSSPTSQGPRRRCATSCTSSSASWSPSLTGLVVLEELQVASEVLEYGASYERQRAILADGGDLTGVLTR